MFGLDYPRYGERLTLLDEAAIAIRALWSGESLTHDGDHLRFREAAFHPRPPSAAPSLILGGKGPKTLAVVAHHTTEWNCSYVGVDAFREKSAALDDRCREIGRLTRRPSAERPGDLGSWTAAGFVGGTSDRVVAQLGAFAEAGAARFILQHNDLDDRSSLDLLAAEVLPHLR